jgi:hypothetical protein
MFNDTIPDKLDSSTAHNGSSYSFCISDTTEDIAVSEPVYEYNPYLKLFFILVISAYNARKELIKIST